LRGNVLARIPESLAYATIADGPPIVGLSAAAPALVRYAGLGGCRHLIVGRMLNGHGLKIVGHADSGLPRFGWPGLGLPGLGLPHVPGRHTYVDVDGWAIGVLASASPRDCVREDVCDETRI
jgi:hypothetical protein